MIARVGCLSCGVIHSLEEWLPLRRWSFDTGRGTEPGLQAPWQLSTVSEAVIELTYSLDTGIIMETIMLRRLSAEAIGSFFLFACVIGSGIMAESLAGGNDAVALLGNTLATGAILAVLIAMLGPISGAHFNPAVTLAFRLRGEIATGEALAFVAVQLAAGIVGVWAAHLMFDQPAMQMGVKPRTGAGQWLGEFVATFGLVLTILGTIRVNKTWVPASVGLYISAAYWFTSSTSFANPAITVARGLSDTFAGIAVGDVPGFVASQFVGAVIAVGVFTVLYGAGPTDPETT